MELTLPCLESALGHIEVEESIEVFLKEQTNPNGVSFETSSVYACKKAICGYHQCIAHCQESRQSNEVCGNTTREM